MIVKITVHMHNFDEWIKMGLELIGSGTYRRDGDTFILNINPDKFWLISELLESWAKSWLAEAKKLNRGFRRPPLKSVYTIEK